MDLNIIFDSRHSEDYERLLKEFSEQGITDYRFWDAVILKDSVVSSINASHKMIVRWAKEQDKKMVCIGEQDLMFPCNEAWNYFLEQMPKEFKLYSACNYLSRDYPTTKELVGFHLYIIHHSYYDDFLKLPDDRHIDTAINGIDIHICYPYSALQRKGWSWNNMAIVDYNKVLQKQDIYSCSNS